MNTKNFFSNFTCEIAENGYFLGSTSHSLRVLTRPLADVSAPKHTAILARDLFWIAGFFLFKTIIY